MTREELLNLLYYVRDIFTRADDLSVQRQKVQGEYKNEIPHETIKQNIAYRPIIKPAQHHAPKKLPTMKTVIKIALVCFCIFSCYTFYDVVLAHGFMWETTREMAKVDLNGFYYTTNVLVQLGFWSVINLIFSVIWGFVGKAFLKLNAESSNVGNQKYLQDIEAKNRLTKQENDKIYQMNCQIDEHNKNLVQINQSIDQKNLEIKQYNLDVDRHLMSVDNEIMALREEARNFLQSGQFPPQDFDPVAVDFYINEVVNLRCESIKECANAYAAYLSDQENKRKMDQMIQNQEESLRKQDEQIRLQRIGNVLQVGNLIATLQNTAAVNNMNESVTGALHQNTDAINRNTEQVGRVADGVAYGNKQRKEIFGL